MIVTLTVLERRFCSFSLMFIIFDGKMIIRSKNKNKKHYRKVMSFNMSPLEAHAGFFRLKEVFDPYVL